MADEEIQASEFFGGGRRKFLHEAGCENRRFGGKGIPSYGPIDTGWTLDGSGKERDERAEACGCVEVTTGKIETALAKCGTEFRIAEKTLARICDLFRGTGFEKDRVAPVLHEKCKIGGREDDGFAGGEKLREF